MTEFVCDHTFRTTLTAAKSEALVVKACRTSFPVEFTAHDPSVVPQLRLFTAGFSTPEDRDRVRIAMRFVEKEQAAMGQAVPRPAAASQLASA